MDPIENSAPPGQENEHPQGSLAARALANGVRLSEDAIVLLKASRFATATSIAIVSLEKLGKYKSCRWEQSGFNIPIGKRWNSHMKRQCIASALILAVCMIEEFQKSISERDLTFNDLMVDDDDNFFIKGKSLEQIPAEWLSEAMDRLNQRTESKLFLVSSVGFMQDVKHAGLYADEQPRNKHLTSSDSIDAETARMYVALSKAVAAVIDDKAVDAAMRSLIESSPLAFIG